MRNRLNSIEIDDILYIAIGKSIFQAGHGVAILDDLSPEGHRQDHGHDARDEEAGDEGHQRV